MSKGTGSALSRCSLYDSLIIPTLGAPLGASLYERLLAEVLAVEVQQIEGVQDDAVGSDSHSRLKRLEVRTAIAIR